MKKILAILLCAVMTLSLVACSSDAGDNVKEKTESSQVRETGKDKATVKKLNLKADEKLYTDGTGYLTCMEDEFGYCTIRVYTEDYELNGTYNGQRYSEEKIAVKFTVGYFQEAIIEYTHSNVGGADMTFSNGNDPLIGFDVSDAAVEFVFADLKEGKEGGSKYSYYDVHRKTYTRVSTFEN